MYIKKFEKMDTVTKILSPKGVASSNTNAIFFPESTVKVRDVLCMLFSMFLGILPEPKKLGVVSCQHESWVNFFPHLFSPTKLCKGA